MSELTYFDCNPLMRWAEHRAAGAAARSTWVAEVVDQLMADANHERFVSEVTIAEFHSNVTTYRRGPEEQYGEEWLGDVMDRFFSLLADGRLVALPPKPRLLERAMAYVSMASRDHGIGLRAWDAAHLVHALDLARSRSKMVSICTGDHAFQRVLDAYPSIAEHVVVLNPEAGRT